MNERTKKIQTLMEQYQNYEFSINYDGRLARHDTNGWMVVYDENIDGPSSEGYGGKLFVECYRHSFIGAEYFSAYDYTPEDFIRLCILWSRYYHMLEIKNIIRVTQKYICIAKGATEYIIDIKNFKSYFDYGNSVNSANSVNYISIKIGRLICFADLMKCVGKRIKTFQRPEILNPLEVEISDDGLWDTVKKVLDVYRSTKIPMRKNYDGFFDMTVEINDSGV